MDLNGWVFRRAEGRFHHERLLHLLQDSAGQQSRQRSGKKSNIINSDNLEHFLIFIFCSIMYDFRFIFRYVFLISTSLVFPVLSRSNMDSFEQN